MRGYRNVCLQMLSAHWVSLFLKMHKGPTVGSIKLCAMGPPLKFQN